MKKDLDLGILESAPHAQLIRELAEKCYADAAVQAIWVGGSLAAGTGDSYSDVDFRLAVAPDRLDSWMQPDWDRYLPEPSYGGTFLRFGDHALLHHLLLNGGTLVDFYVQDTSVKNHEPNIVIIACRNELFGDALADFSRTPAPLANEIQADVARQFLIDYWITTHKEMKGLGRRYDYTSFVGLYFERMALLRAWYMEHVGKAIDARVSIHMLGALHRGLDGKLTTEQKNLLGLPSRTPDETVVAVEAIRAEMSRVSRLLSERYGFQYPHDLENVVLKTWSENKQAFTKR